MKHSTHTFLGTTQSLCPSCLELLPAKIISRQGRIYFQKRCKKCGPREDFVCSDESWYDRLEYMLPSRVPEQHGKSPDKGCPYDCGLCTDHEQHTCIGLVELTSSCNLKCPMCFAESGPKGKHLPLEECKAAIDRLVEVEGRPEVLQLSGGEPTLHPDFETILEYAYAQPIDYIMINTNGLRFAHDPDFVELVAKKSDRVEAFFQFDGLDPETTIKLRAEDILATKLKALEKLGDAGVHVTLAVTLQGGVNEHEIGPIIRFAEERPWIVAINFQPATYSGRFELPEVLEKRITFPDVIKAAESQTDRTLQEGDFMPLPCAHPNCHSVSYIYRSSQGLVPFARFIDTQQNYDLLANGITLNRERAKNLLLQVLGRQSCCGGDCGPMSTPARSTAQPNSANASLQLLDNGCESNSNGQSITDSNTEVANEFFGRALKQELGAKDVLRITITSFLDAYNFDVRRLMKCCTHHVLPSGHVIPFCAYNVLYRNGHVPLPTLDQLAIKEA